MSELVKVVEVGPRDGLQNQAELVPLDRKLAFLDMLAEAGFSEIEATSFVHPKWVPQLADSEEVCRRLKPRAGLSYTVLVPNLKGLERAEAAGVKRIAVFMAASQSFSQKNTNRSIAESLSEFEQLIPRARAAGMSVRGYLSTVFHCPYEGPILPVASLPLCEKLLELGCDEISLGDTVGRAVPTEIEAVLEVLQAHLPKLALHLHDTCGTALANVLRGLQMGVRTFDSSAGGLGGCPYAPGASGNVSTEDLLYMLHGMGYKTGVDAALVARAAQSLDLPLVSHQQKVVRDVP